MDNSGRIFLGIILAFVIISAGLSLGFFLRFKSPLPSPGATENTVAQETNNNTYDISPPSRGAAIVTHPVEIHPIGNTSFTTLPTAEAGAIKTGQKILLYGANGAMLETVGEVTKIVHPKIEGSPDITVVHFLLNEDEEQPASDVVKGEIVIERNTNIARLPLSALIRSEKGEIYVWEASESEDGTYTAYLKPVKTGITTYTFFGLEPLASSSGVYILNPDEKLRDGQKINVNKTLYAAPAETDEQKMERLMKARQERLHDQREALIQENIHRMKQERITAGDQQSQAINPSANNSCNITDDFLKTVKQLGNKEKPAAIAP